MNNLHRTIQNNFPPNWLIIFLFVLLSPLLIWNNLTWTEEYEKNFQQTLERFKDLPKEMKKKTISKKISHSLAYTLRQADEIVRKAFGI